MAEDVNTWCYDSTKTLDKIQQSAVDYYEKLKTYHDSIPQEVWSNIEFEPTVSKSLNLETKPDFEILYELNGEFVNNDWSWFEKGSLIRYQETLKNNELRLFAETKDRLAKYQDLGDIRKYQKEIPTIPATGDTAPPEEYWFAVEIINGDWLTYTYTQLGETINGIEPALLNSPLKQVQNFAEVLNKFYEEITFAGLAAIEKCPTEAQLKEEYETEIRKLVTWRLDLAVEEARRKVKELKDAETADKGQAFHNALLQAEKALAKAQQSVKFSLETSGVLELFSDQIVYSEQCMLLTFLPELLVSNSSKGLPYVNPESSNYPLKAQGESFGFINKLVVDPSQKELFELKNEVVSQLVPYIRLYKVEKDKKGKDQQIEIKFDTNISNDLNISSNTLRRQRGYGVGMNSFTFSYDGTDPFSAKKAISAKLSIFASTFDDLLRERDGFKYADLALKTGGISKKRTLNDIEKENAEKLNFRLKAVVGWNVPRETFVGFSEEIRNAMYNSYITVYLTPTIHSFDFDETGAVNFDIEYLAYIEDAMAQRSFNIFSNVAVEQTAMEAAMNELNKMDCDESSPEFQKLKKVNEEFVSTVNLKAYSSLVSKLAARDKIYFLNMTYDDVARILQNPDDDDIVFPKPYTNSMVSQTTANAMKKAASLASGSLEQVGQNILSVAAVSQDNESIPYFYLEDLVAVAMDNIEQTLKKGQDTASKSEYLKFIKDRNAMNINIYRALQKTKSIPVEYKNNLQQFQQMRILLGPIEIFSPSRKYASFKTTLANIPISLNYFFEFMSDKVLSKEIINYPITKFIKDLVNDLIKNFLNSDGCTRVSNKQKININSTTISAYNRSKNPRAKWQSTDLPSHDDITYFLSNPQIPRENPILQLNGKRDTPQNMPIEQMINYYVFSAGRKYPNDQYVGNKTQDENVGIFHYILGRDRGIIKNISLERTTATGLKEVRFEQEGYNGLEQLREVYNVKVDSFLNVQTFPGTYIYVDPRGFSPNTTEDLTRFGIGGYCMITKTSHTIRPGEATTTIDAAWVASKEGDSDANKEGGTNGEEKKRKPEGNEKIRKCVVGVIDLGRLITGRDNLGLTPEERGKLGDELVKAANELGTNEGIYTV